MARKVKRKGPKNPRPELGSPDDPLALSPLVRGYLEHMEVRGFSEWTIRNDEHNLYCFLVWCEERSLMRATDVTRPIILRYQRWIFHYRQKNGNPLGVRAQQKRLTVVIGLFRWLTREGYILYNPASEIDLPRTPKRLPKHVLSVEEAETVLALPDIRDPLGLRDRAILEVLYSTGIRRMELIQLGLHDVDLDRQTMNIREGKGRRDRMIPAGERACRWITKYLADVRPSLVVEPDPGSLFLTHHGEPFSRNGLSSTVHRYVKSAGLHKTGSCHLFRHSMATLMLEGGADIRYVQAMLGHQNIQSTELYTHVAIRKLQEIHTITHPGAVMKPKKQVTPANEESESKPPADEDDERGDEHETVH
jgi:integrase/recombinase XerD